MKHPKYNHLDFIDKNQQKKSEIALWFRIFITTHIGWVPFPRYCTLPATFIFMIVAIQKKREKLKWILQTKGVLKLDVQSFVSLD